MTGSEISAGPEAPLSPIPRSSLLIVLGIMSLFLVLRVPVLLRQIPAQDEDYFAVAGYTILEEGIPRIPYMPSRNPESAFYRVDEVLYLLPPLYFYLEAAVYAVIGPSTAAARLTSMLAGLGSFWLIYLLGRHWLRSETAALLATGLYAFSRVVYFPCLIARPDMLFGFWGLAALLCMSYWSEQRRLRWLISAGVCIGCGFLTHPATLIFALQLGFWSLLAGNTLVNRLKTASILTSVSILMTTLWLPLILQAPEVFKHQFGNNVLSRTGPGLLTRAVLPMQSIGFQWKLFLEHTGPLQVVLLFVASLIVTGLAWRQRNPRLRSLVWLTWGGLYLHIICQGTHSTKGYWCYTTAPLFLLTGHLLATLLQTTSENSWKRWGLRTVVAGVFFCLLPGSGLRTLAVHLREWDNVNYDAPRFTARLIEQFPQEGQFVVDPGFVFDFYRSGRDTKLALIYPFFYDVTNEQYDVLIGGPYSIRDGVHRALEAEYLRTEGNPDDMFACYAKVFTAPAHRRPAHER